MMFCGACGARIGEGSRFCSACGEPVSLIGRPEPLAESKASTPPAGSWQDWLRRLREPRLGVPVVIGGLIIILGLVALAGAASSAQSSGRPIRGKIAGDMGHDSFSTAINGSQAALDALEWDNVWCGWQGGHVVVHATFTNTSGASVVVHIAPAYDVVNAGTHGDSSDITANVPAGKTVSWLGDAGSPQGVAVGTPLAHCGPGITEVDLG